MCCFSRAVEHVSATKIFARRIGADRQALVYGMQFEIAEDLAMVLPLPTPADAPEDAVVFVDLSGYERFFADLDAAFPVALMAPQSRGGLVASGAHRVLEVHDVGAFVASFVPSPADFSRLDPRFRLPADVVRQLVGSGATGFAVFQLKAKTRLFGFRTKRQVSQPMAFVFPTNRPGSLFFPTLHVHDGEHLPRTARFDHTLYLQGDAAVRATIGWQGSSDLRDAMDLDRAGGLVDHGPAFRTSVLGEQPNRDVWIELPSLSPDELVRDHELVRLELVFEAAYDPFDQVVNGRSWSEASRKRRWVDRFEAALVAFVRSNRDRLGLVPLSDDLDAHWLNGNRLWTGRAYDDGNRGEGKPGMAGTLRVRVWTDRVEPQWVTLAFDSIPDHAACVALRDELAALLEHAEADRDKP